VEDAVLDGNQVNDEPSLMITYLIYGLGGEGFASGAFIPGGLILGELIPRDIDPRGIDPYRDIDP